MKRSADKKRESVGNDHTKTPRTFKPFGSVVQLLIIAMTSVIALLLLVQPSAAAAVDCNADSGTCKKEVKGLSVAFDITPKPVAVMRELTYFVTIKDGGLPVDDADLAVDFSMPGMFMGKNVVHLALRKDGVYTGKGVIIRCPSGEKIWKALVTVKRGSKITTVPFVFEVRK